MGAGAGGSTWRSRSSGEGEGFELTAGWQGGRGLKHVEERSVTGALRHGRLSSPGCSVCSSTEQRRKAKCPRRPEDGKNGERARAKEKAKRKASERARPTRARVFRLFGIYVRRRRRGRMVQGVKVRFLGSTRWAQHGQGAEIQNVETESLSTEVTSLLRSIRLLDPQMKACRLMRV